MGMYDKGESKGTRVFNQKQCHDFLVIIVVINIFIGLIALHEYMNYDKTWMDEPQQRNKVLAIAVLLFLSACALSWIFMVSLIRQRAEYSKWQSKAGERRLLIIDRPPSYESCVLSSEAASQPPPSYFTVINTIRIV